MVQLYIVKLLLTVPKINYHKSHLSFRQFARTNTRELMIDTSVTLAKTAVRDYGVYVFQILDLHTHMDEDKGSNLVNV